MHLLLLAGRRGSGKSTSASALETAGWTLVHTASVAAAAQCPKDPSGVLLRVVEPLSAAVAAAGARVVVDGSPRSIEQALWVEQMATAHDVHVVVLDIPSTTAADRLHRRGESETTIARAQHRWDETEGSVLEHLSPELVSFIAADGSPAEVCTAVLEDVLMWESALEDVN